MNELLNNYSLYRIMCYLVNKYGEKLVLASLKEVMMNKRSIT